MSEQPKKSRVWYQPALSTTPWDPFSTPLQLMPSTISYKTVEEAIREGRKWIKRFDPTTKSRLVVVRRESTIVHWEQAAK